MSILVEGATIVTWWTTFHVSKDLIVSSSPGRGGEPSTEYKALSSAISGGFSGALVAAICLPIKTARMWPESREERRFMGAYSSPYSTAMRMAASHALFFTVYSGLKEGIYRARIKSGRTDLKRDLQDGFNDFLAGFVSGLCYRGGSMGWNFGIQVVPLTPQMVILTGLKMGIASSVLSSVDDWVRKELKS